MKRGRGGRRSDRNGRNGNKNGRRSEKGGRKADEIDLDGLINAIIDDDVEKFDVIMQHAHKSDIFVLSPKYNLPKIIAACPTVVSLCAFFNSDQCTESIMKRNPSLLKEDKYGRTVAHFAAAGGNNNFLEKILENERLINTPDKLGDHPIAYAAMFDHLSTVKLLFEQCKDKEEVFSQALRSAARFGHLDIIKFFIEEVKMPVNSKGVFNNACANGNKEIVDYLVKKGAEINKPDETGVFPIIDAINSGQLATVKLLIQEGANYERKGEAYVPLIEAAALGFYDIVKFLIEKGVDINATNKNGVTALQAALETKNLAISEYLINSGADVNKISEVLVHAARFGNLRILKEVFERIEDKETQIKSKKILNTVINTGRMDCLKYLLDMGMLLSSQDILFYNLIELSIKNESPEILSYAIEGAGEIQKNKLPFKYALNCIRDNDNIVTDNMLKCLKILIDAGANIFGGASRTEFFYRIFNIQSEEFYMLILNNKQDFDLRKFIGLNLKTTWKNICGYDKGAPSPLFDFFLDNLLDVNATDNKGVSILHDVIKNEKGDELVARLIKKGVNVNQASEFIQTPLLLSINYRKYATGCMLLKNGADPNIRGLQNELPIEVAASTDDALFLTQMLIKNGSELGDSLAKAMENKSYKTAALLIMNGADYSALKNAREIKRIIDNKKGYKELISALKGEKKSLLNTLLGAMSFC